MVTLSFMSRILIVVGGVLLALGLLWPLLQKSGLGRLPGDFYVDRGNFKFYFPLTTSILVSLLITLILWLIRK